MSKEDLILLRNQLLAEKARRIYTDALISENTIEPSDKYLSKAQIYDSIPFDAEKETVEYFEEKLEEIIRNAINGNVNFSGISSPIIAQFYITRNLVQKLDNNGNLNPNDFDRNEVLDDIVIISFSYNFIGSNHASAESYLNDIRELDMCSFTINYNEFVKVLLEHGFDINAKTFDELLAMNLKGEKVVIAIDFTKTNTYTKHI